MTLEKSLIATSNIRFDRKKQKSYTGTFEELLLEAVEEGFSCLGDSCKQAIYFRLMDCYNISKHEIPYKIREFANAIEGIFGPGARFLEIRIMNALYGRVQSFKYFPEQEELSFTNYVEILRNFL